MGIDALPRDNMMLLSFVNTRLRDDKINLEEFCSQFDVSKEDIASKLATIDYKYDENLNRFV